MKVVGITGRSGCGKSSATDFLREKGYPCIDADLVAREVLLPGSPCIAQLQQVFGADIADENGTVRRRLLADRAFATPEGKAALDGLTHPEIVRRIRAAKQVLRELDFITALPASAVLAAQGSARPQADSAAAQARVLVQGIADIVLVFDDHIELLDYKTDRKKTEQEFLDAYRAQLNLYALAIEKRFAPKPVTYKGIYSFSLNRLLEVET